MQHRDEKIGIWRSRLPGRSLGNRNFPHSVSFASCVSHSQMKSIVLLGLALAGAVRVLVVLCVSVLTLLLRRMRASCCRARRPRAT